MLILVAGNGERDAVLAAAQRLTGRRATRSYAGDHTVLKLGAIGGVGVMLAQIVVEGSAGPGGSEQTTASLLAALSPDYLILTGTCRAIRTKVAAGDIVVATRLITPYGDRPVPSTLLIDKFQAATVDRHASAVHFGHIVSTDRATAHEPDAIAWEREGAGVYAAAAKARIDWAVVRGVAGEDRHAAAQGAAAFVIGTIAEGGLQPPPPPPPTSRQPRTAWRLPPRAAWRSAAAAAMIGALVAASAGPTASGSGYIVVYSARVLEVQPPQFCSRRVVDLDQLTTSLVWDQDPVPPKMDFVYHGCDKELTIAGTRAVAFGRGRSAGASPDECATDAHAPKPDTAEPVAWLEQGTVLCAITDRGSVARMTVIRKGEPYAEGADKPALELRVTLWIAYPPRSRSTWLVDAPVEEERGRWERGRRGIGGTSYARSYTAYTTSEPTCEGSRPAIVFDLGRQYKRFTVTVGISDSEEGSAQAKFWAELDDRPLFDREVAKGQREAVDVSVAGGRRLRLSVRSATCGGWFIWGDGNLLR